MNYECECGKSYKTRGWLTRHRRGCAVYQATVPATMARATRKAFVPKLVITLFETSPLMKLLSGQNPVEKRVSTLDPINWKSYAGTNPATKTVT